MRLGWRLAQHVEANRLGIVGAAETGFKLASNPDTVRGADIAFVSKTRLEEVGEVEGYWILTEHDTLEGGDVIPDFRCRVREVFG
jgi:hypothetical protein